MAQVSELLATPGVPAMETETMGRVLTEATIENLEDLWAVKRGLLASEQVRQITVADALVDTGATLLSLPTRLIQQLGSNAAAEREGLPRDEIEELAVPSYGLDAVGVLHASLADYHA